MRDYITQQIRIPDLRPRWLARGADGALAALIAAALLVPWWLGRADEPAAATPHPAIVVRVTQTPAVMVDAHPVAREALVAHLRKLDPDGRTIVVKADAGVKFDRVRSVLMDCEGLGFARVSLLQPEPARASLP